MHHISHAQRSEESPGARERKPELSAPEACCVQLARNRTRPPVRTDVNHCHHDLSPRCPADPERSPQSERSAHLGLQ